MQWHTAKIFPFRYHRCEIVKTFFIIKLFHSNYACYKDIVIMRLAMYKVMVTYKWFPFHLNSYFEQKFLIHFVNHNLFHGFLCIFQKWVGVNYHLKYVFLLFCCINYSIRDLQRLNIVIIIDKKNLILVIRILKQLPDIKLHSKPLKLNIIIYACILKVKILKQPLIIFSDYMKMEC